MLNQLFWIVPICSVIALLFAWFFFKGMMKESEGNCEKRLLKVNNVCCKKASQEIA